jgi:uncharacterized membrane protein YsdA (DUF1294 family)/cold shock CspA family protein
VRSKGKIATWKDDKGFGFIEPFGGGSQVFIHIKAIKNRSRRPEVGDVVTYSIAKDAQGRVRAEGATIAGAQSQHRAGGRPGKISLPVAILFLGAVGVSVFIKNLPPEILIFYVAASLVTFLAYALDKSAAQSGRWRTKEGTLLLFGLVGGWPGALIAQQMLRHKSKKVSFRVFLWLTILMNCAAFVWLHTPEGQKMLEQILG